MAFRPSTPELLPSAKGDGDTFSIRGWKVFVPGYWKGQLFGKERIEGILDTWKLLKNLIPLQYSPKFRQGHDLKKRLTESLGLPNIGTVSDMRLTPDGGFEVDIENIPRTVLTVDEYGNSKAFDLQKAIQSGNYDGGSVELKPEMSHPTDPRQKLHDVFDGVSLLGEEHPAIKLTDSPSRHVHSADGLARLAFSDFSKDPPMPLPTDGQPDKKKQLADAMGMDVNDPAIQSLNDEQVDAFLDQIGSQKFSDCMKKKFSDPLATASANPPVPGVDDPNAPVTKQMFADMQKQVFALEAANNDLKNQLQGTAGNGMVTMSEAYRVIDEEVIKAGRASPQLRDIFKADAKRLLSLPAPNHCFADGPHKGRAQVAVFLDELRARPVDSMFSEMISDTAPADADQPLSTLSKLALEATAAGRAILRKTKAA